MAVPEEIWSVENSTGIVVGQLKAICTWHRFVDIITFLLESSCDHSEVSNAKQREKESSLHTKFPPCFDSHVPLGRNYENWFTRRRGSAPRNLHFLIQLRDSKRGVCSVFIKRISVWDVALVFGYEGKAEDQCAASWLMGRRMCDIATSE